MELRHLRFFVAVAETGSLTRAAETRLHTAQPSLSRQMRDLEFEVGVALMIRGAGGIELTPAGRAFLDHARLALAQVDAAREAARRAARPERPAFALGFLTGQEMDWMQAALAVLHDELPNVDVTVSSQYSPDLAQALQHGRLDLALMRAEKEMPDLAYQTVLREELVLMMPSDHPLAARDAVAIEDLAGETFLRMSRTAPVMRELLDAFFARHALNVAPDLELDNLGMAMSLVASTRALTLLPAYAKNFLPWSVASRPLLRDAPAVDLVAGWHRANASPILKLFLSRLDVVAEKARDRSG